MFAMLVLSLVSSLIVQHANFTFMLNSNILYQQLLRLSRTLIFNVEKVTRRKKSDHIRPEPWQINLGAGERAQCLLLHFTKQQTDQSHAQNNCRYTKLFTTNNTFWTE